MSLVVKETTLKRKYCIFGCDKLDVHVHRFPHPINHQEWFSSWVAVMGDKLQGEDPMFIYKNKRVCDYHFLPEDITAGRRVVFGAVPSLNLNGVFQTKYYIEREHNYALFSSVSLANEQGPSTSTNMQDHICRCGPSTSTILQGPSTSNMSCFDNDNQYTMECFTDQFTIGDDEGNKDCSLDLKRTACSANPSSLEIRNLKKNISRLRKKNISLSARLSNATKLASNLAFQRVARNMTEAGKIFTQMQMKTSKKPKGRRFTIPEKVLSTSLFKRSPKCYTLLCKYFSLPLVKTIKSLLSQVKIGPGINKIVFEELKKTMAKMSEEERLCTLIFDEMSITPQVHYNAGSDELKGFVSYEKKNIIADHALVFMVKGIRKSYKQPVAYYFTRTLKKYDLKKIITEVIFQVQYTGLKILCTVCDQSTINVSTITSLVEDTKINFIKKGKEWRFDMFELHKQAIIPIYDVPHLLKGIRNNLINKDLKYVDINGDKEEKTLKWEYFLKLCQTDKSYGELRYLQKITEEHVLPEKMKKMRVKTAAQLFSRSVAVAAEHLTARGDLPQECRQIVPFVLMIDNLFDSFNCNTFHVPNGKVYKSAVRKNSPHHKLWYSAKKFLESMKYLSKEKVNGNKIKIVERCVPTVANFIKTIMGMQQVCKILHEKYLLDSIFTRHFNQDPIENFFGSIRSLGARNISPNVIAFEGAYKTLLLNNFNTPHAYNSNCEEDMNSCLQKLDFFITEKNLYDNQVSHTDTDIIINKDLECLFAERSEMPQDSGTDQREYVCGWVLGKCLKKVVKSCKACKQTLCSIDSNDNKYIATKEYYKNKQWLCYPSKQLKECFYEIQKLVVNTLKYNTLRNGLKTNIKMLAEIFVLYPFNCSIHKEKLKTFFLDTTINVIIYSWCRSINRILAGKITYYDGDDELKKAAQAYYCTHSKHRK